MWNSSPEFEAWHREILTVSDNRWSCGRAIFQGNPTIKTIKRVVHFMIVLEILDHRQTSNQFDMTISVGDISFLVVFTCRRSEIRETHRRSHKNIFSTNNTFHLIIMMIGVVLCKINEEINYVSAFHYHVVRIWLRNRSANLLWNRNKNT